MSPLHFGVLGALRVDRGGRAVGLGSPAQRRLLAALLVQPGTVVSVDRLIDVLWRDRPPATAKESLRTQVYRLRRLLHDGDDERLLTRPPGYLLHADPGEVDASRFQAAVARARDALPGRPATALDALEQGLALWRGPAFAEFADAQFAQAEARRLEELRLAATEDLLEVKLALGRHAEVAGEAEALVADHPLRERPHGQLMLALYRCGQQARALAAHRAFRARLDDELGLEPSERLRELEAAILQQRPALDWAPPADSTSARGLRGQRTPTVGRSPGQGEARGAAPGWLPPERTSLVGRSGDVAAVSAALARERAVCLVGAGGVGKSRLALRAAREAAYQFPDGAWWCDLAAVAAAGDVAGAMAASVGLDQPSGQSVESALVESLASRRLLLVADNCEHVAEEASRLLESVVDACPDVRVLATSRVPLATSAARAEPVDPLPVPESDDADDVMAADSARLFIERAAAVRPGFEPRSADLASVADICRRLDGLPAAIELAAARMRSLNAHDIAQRLDDRFRLLAGGNAAAATRHETMRAVIDWSFNLLSKVEQSLFARLSVFAGEFTLEAAEHVCSGYPVEPHEVVDLLDRLVDASMVTVGPAHGEVGYRLLETMRAYGRARLAEAGETEETAATHARYYVGLAEQVAVGVRGTDEARWVRDADRAFPNIREAFGWAVARDDADTALRIPTALFRYAMWRLRDEVFRWAETALELDGADGHRLLPGVCGVAGWGCGLRGQRPRALELAARGADATAADDPRRLLPLEVEGHIALWEGRLDECDAVMAQAAALAGDDLYELLPWTVRALAAAYRGRTDEALALAEEAQGRADRLGNPAVMALTRYCMAEALSESRPEQAAGLLDHATELAASVRARMLVGVAGVAATALRARHGDTATALRSSAAVLDVWAEASDWTHMWVGLRSLAELFARVGADRAAAVLLGAVLEAETAPPVYGADAERLATLADELEGRLGARELADARSRGHAMRAADALAFARAEIDRAMAAD